MAGNREMGSLRSSGDSIEGDRTLVRAWLLRSLVRYVATELWLKLGRYVATEILLELGRYVATERFVATELLARARSLRIDRAEHVFGCCVATLFELLSDD
ncbi:hypothetical protein DY000_02052410 [Brassica cretica]|uniref:MI domain-containing protein n=1 Tax=Brassica cretica TaxID=69181 RepID=A0ABQ7AK26_BRACR|nr:hypothetical protein DY000_02052410 [Brassica cretica]